MECKKKNTGMSVKFNMEYDNVLMKKIIDKFN